MYTYIYIYTYMYMYACVYIYTYGFNLTQHNIIQQYIIWYNTIHLHVYVYAITVRYKIKKPGEKNKGLTFVRHFKGKLKEIRTKFQGNLRK